MTKILLATGELAERLQCTPQHVRVLTRRGELTPAARTFDGRLLFDLETALDLLTKEETPPPAKVEAFLGHETETRWDADPQ